MGESGKALLALVVVVCLPATFFVWWLEGISLPIRFGFTLTGLIALVVLLLALYRKDKVPDFLRRLTGGYFERDCFCFALFPVVDQGQCRFDVYFQNRYARRCLAQVVIQPSRQFWLNRRPVGTLTLPIECEGASFGVARVPWPIPVEFQGRTQSFDLAALVSYPEARGALVRYRDSAGVGSAKLEAWKIVGSVALAFGSQIVLWKPASLKVRLPANVAETVPDDSPISIETLWRPGEPAEPLLSLLAAGRGAVGLRIAPAGPSRP